MNHWSWLSGDDHSDKQAAVYVAKLFNDLPKFWERIQETVRSAGSNGDQIEDAIREIEEWLQVKDPWQHAISNCRAGLLPEPWPTRPDDLAKAASRIRKAVIDPMPDVLRHCLSAVRQRQQEASSKRYYASSEGLGAAEISFRPAGEVEMDHTGQEAFGDKDFSWRFFGDPDINQRRHVDFPVALIIGEDHCEAKTDPGPEGHIVTMRLEVLDPGVGVVATHPVLGLAGIDMDDGKFKPSVEAALTAASKVVGTAVPQIGTPRVTAAFFSLDFFEPGRQITSLAGRSAGGAFALAFARTLADKAYDQRVLVIAEVDAEGSLAGVDNETLGDRTYLELKAQAIVKHNNMVARQPRNLNVEGSNTGVSAHRIDTVAVMKAQAGVMVKALTKVGVSENDVRVQAIEDLAPR